MTETLIGKLKELEPDSANNTMRLGFYLARDKAVFIAEAHEAQSNEIRVIYDAEGVHHDWVNCPVCGEPDMRKTLYGEERDPLIRCVNHACASNGGGNASALKRECSEIPGDRPVCLPEDSDLDDVSKIVHCHDCGKKLAAEEIKYLTNTCGDCEPKRESGELIPKRVTSFLIGKLLPMGSGADIAKAGNAHLMLMLHQIQNGEITGNKAHRWLGFVQGAMVLRGYIAVDEERERTRPLFNSIEDEQSS